MKNFDKNLKENFFVFHMKIKNEIIEKQFNIFFLIILNLICKTYLIEQIFD
jgi:hypothetical protein